MANDLAGKSLWVAATPEIVSQRFMGLPTGTLKEEPLGLRGAVSRAFHEGT